MLKPLEKSATTYMKLFKTFKGFQLGYIIVCSTKFHCNFCNAFTTLLSALTSVLTRSAWPLQSLVSVCYLVCLWQYSEDNVQGDVTQL